MIWLIIPARRSQGITGKNLATVDGSPLIQRAWCTAQSVAQAFEGAKVVIATDDPRIQAWDGVHVYAREQSDADQTLADLWLELMAGLQIQPDDVVAWLQCNALPAPEAIARCISATLTHKRSTMTVAPWHGTIVDQNGLLVCQTKSNRQTAGTYMFTGGCLAHVASRPRFSDHNDVVVVPPTVDIDTSQDLWRARYEEKLPTVYSLAEQGEGVGTGHMVRQEILRQHLPHKRWYTDTGQLPPDPTPPADCMVCWDRRKPPETTFDWAFNVIFSDHDDIQEAENVMVVRGLTGPCESVLHPYYDCCLPASQGQGILVTMGGEDAPDYSSRLHQLLPEATIVLGPQYHGALPLGGMVVRGNLTELMLSHDTIITGNGRTVLEAMSLGRQVIRLPMNDYDRMNLPDCPAPLATSPEHAVQFIGIAQAAVDMRPSVEALCDRIIRRYQEWRACSQPTYAGFSTRTSSPT